MEVFSETSGFEIFLGFKTPLLHFTSWIDGSHDIIATTDAPLKMGDMSALAVPSNQFYFSLRNIDERTLNLLHSHLLNY